MKLQQLSVLRRPRCCVQNGLDVVCGKEWVPWGLPLCSFPNFGRLRELPKICGVLHGIIESGHVEVDRSICSASRGAGCLVADHQFGKFGAASGKVEISGALLGPALLSLGDGIVQSGGGQGCADSLRFAIWQRNPHLRVVLVVPRHYARTLRLRESRTGVNLAP